MEEKTLYACFWTIPFTRSLEILKSVNLLVKGYGGVSNDAKNNTTTFRGNCSIVYFSLIVCTQFKASKPTSRPTCYTQVGGNKRTV